MKFIDLAVRRWQITLVVFALMALLGTNALLTIPRSVDPHFPIPVVVVIAVQPGADPADMEQTIAKPIEDVLQGLDNIREIRSKNLDGSTAITAEFEWSSDPEKNYDEVVREVNAIRSTLPQGLQRLEFRKVRTTETAVVQLALVSETASFRRMEKIADDLRDRLNQVPGVRRSSVYGLPKPEVRVAIDSGRLAQLGIAPTMLTDALKNGGVDLPAGAVHSGGQRFNVEAGGAFRSLDEVEDTLLRAADGRVVRVRDVADVSWGYEERQHVTRFNGRRALWVTVTQKDNVNVLDVREGIDKVLKQFKSQLPPDVELEVGFDQSDDIKRKLADLSRDFAIAVGLVLLTLLPLGWRASLVVMISIPLSLAMGLLAMQTFGFTLNQLAISGFILALGLLVDDSIVVTENIARHLREGESRAQAALNATKQIAVAVVGCTAVLVFAFLPLVFLPEGAGKFTRSLPLAVLTTVTASLFVSLTIVPFLASRMLPKHEGPEGNALLRAINRGIHRFYGPVLHASLERPRRAFIAAMALCVSAFALVPVLGFSLFPSADVPYFIVEVEAPEGAALKTTGQAVDYVSQTLAGEPAIVRRLANVGRGNPQIFYNVREEDTRTNYGNVVAVLDEWDVHEGPAMIARLQEKFAAYPDAQLTIRIFENGPPIEAPIAIRVSGPELEELKRLAGKIERVLRTTPGTRDVENPVAVDRTDLNLGLDAEKAALLGVAPGAVRRVTRLALAGEPAGRYRDSEGDTYDVVVRLPMDERQPVSALERIYVPSTSGGSIPLRQIATPKLESVPAQIDRFKLQRTVTVSAFTQSGFLTSKVNDAVMAAIGKLDLPAGYSISVGGEADARARSFGGLGGIVLIAVFGVLGVLVIEFGRFRETAVVAGVIPLGMFGGLIALALTGYSLSYMAIIGFVALIGIEIKNSILLVDFTAQLRREGYSLREAIERAGEIRFLPVLLTSVTAIGGLLPLALGGTSLYAPLAWVIIGGLVSSTLLSRIVTPVMYLLLAQHAPDVMQAQTASTPRPEPRPLAAE